MSFRDSAIPPSKIITIRYRDKFVDLETDSEHYATMTQNAKGDRIEFDFSMCRVIGVRDIPITEQPMIAPARKVIPESTDSRINWPR